jgi:hypothetical protein
VTASFIFRRVRFGHPVPVVLRPREDKYLFIGQYFAYELMAGEAIKEFEYGNIEANCFILTRISRNFTGTHLGTACYTWRAFLPWRLQS